MSKKDTANFNSMNSSRRDFIKKAGTAVAGLIAAPYMMPSGVLTYQHKKESSFLATVAITNTMNTPADSYIYDDVTGGVKQKMQYLFEQLGGVSDVFSKGKKVVMKMNMTGGSGTITDPKLQGLPMSEAMWVHFSVVKATAQLIIDSGVSPSDITIVESLESGDTFSLSVFEGYLDIQNSLGCNLVNISEGTFVDVSTGSNYYNFPALTMNKIIQDAEVYVSMAKLKQHAEAGITCSIKNQIGSVPKPNYFTDSIKYRRQAIHSPTNGSSASFLPRSVCDLFAARPVHFAVVDGIKNAKGGEGVWNPNFIPFQSHVLFAGKDPVATDSIGAYLMGLDCEAEKLQLPGDNGYGDTECDNYLKLLNAKGAGTNKLSEINVVGDGKDLITSVQPDGKTQPPEKFQLCSNYPNPFNPATMIVFYLPQTEFVTLKIYDITGRMIETLIEGEVPSGEHRLQWTAEGLASGIYLCRMEAKSFSQTIKMIYQK